MIVIACNTASAAAEGDLELKRNPHSGCYRQGLRQLPKYHHKRIGVIGTVGTINSQAYDKAIKGISPENIELVSVACPGFGVCETRRMKENKYEFLQIDS